MLAQNLRRSGGETDPLFASVQLLCRFDGPSGVVTASQVRDLSRYRRVAASVGPDTQFSQPAYFGQGLLIPTSGDVVTFADDANLRFNDGDFTIEVIANRGALTGTQSIISKGVHNSSGWELRFNGSTVEFRYGASSVMAPTLGTTPYLSATEGDVWYFIQVTRNGTSMSIFLYHLTGSRAGNNSIGSATSALNFNQTNVLYIGANRQGGTPLLASGLIDEIRLTADNRNTSIPSRPFPGK